MTASTPDYYELLGVPVTATDAQIRAAYRALVKTTHPDAGGNAALFRMVTQAYDTLSDSTLRQQYDRAAGRATPPPAGGGTGTAGSAGGPFGNPFGNTTGPTWGSAGSKSSSTGDQFRWGSGGTSGSDSGSHTWSGSTGQSRSSRPPDKPLIRFGPAPSADPAAAGSSVPWRQRWSAARQARAAAPHARLVVVLQVVAVLVLFVWGMAVATFQGWSGPWPVWPLDDPARPGMDQLPAWLWDNAVKVFPSAVVFGTVVLRALLSRFVTVSTVVVVLVAVGGMAAFGVFALGGWVFWLVLAALCLVGIALWRWYDQAG